VTVVLDSSVIIAAHVSRAGVCAELYEEVLAHHSLILSRHIVDEVRRKLAGKFLMPESLVARATDTLMRAGRLVEPAAIEPSACRDPDDLPILGTAAAGDAELLVTVDNDLLDLESFGSIAIVRPGQFWELTLRR
jgi:putative PIN family toxin of toxin-antitoxin system